MESLSYESTSTAEFGDLISFAAGTRAIKTVTVAMSSWTCQTYPCATTPGSSYPHPVTLNLYQVNTGATPTPGALITTITDTFQIPFRPSPTGECGTGFTAPDDPKDGCTDGLAFTIEFDLKSVIVPNNIIYGITYNTQSHGPNPTGIPGPADSLNVAVTTAAATVGTNVNPDVVYWDTLLGDWYADGGAGGIGVFRADTGWNPYTVAIRFATVAAPALTTEICKNGGHIAAGFRNLGQCIASFNANK